MPKLDCYYKPGQHIQAPDLFTPNLYSEFYLDYEGPADFDKAAIDEKIDGLAELIEDCDNIYSSCENIENDIVACFSMDDKPLDVFDLQLCSDIMFRLKEISRYGIEHLKEKTTEVDEEISFIKTWLYTLSRRWCDDPCFNPTTYTKITRNNIFDYGSWVPKEWW